MKDCEAIYDEQIFPLMAKIIAICEENEIPILCSFRLNDGNEKDPDPLYCTTHLGNDERLKKALLGIIPNPQSFAFTIRRET